MSFIISYIGITRDPETKEFMLIMTYADKGDLHKYLQKEFASITWIKKLSILWIISVGYLSLYSNLLTKFNIIFITYHFLI